LSAFNARYPGASIREAELEQEDAGPLYKFDFNDASGTRQTAFFTPAGAFVERSSSGGSGGGNGGDDGGGSSGGSGGGGSGSGSGSGGDDGPGHD
jgi:hypothetical protein